VSCYVWNTTGTAAGTHYLDASMCDFSTGQAVSSNLGTSVVIG
jgi:hypothetical protein